MHAGATLRAILCGFVCIAAAEAAVAQSPGLDRLLRLPESSTYATEEKGGAGRSEWRQRFETARKGVADAEKALAESQAKLATVAGEKSEWQFKPPGVPASDDQDSSSAYQLRDQVRRNRGEVDRARARLRELDVEANLAGVPEEWRGASTDAHSGDAPSDETGTAPTTRR